MIRKAVLGCDWSSCQGVVDVGNVVRQSAHNPHPVRFAKLRLWHAQSPSGNRDGVEYEKAIADLTNPDLPDPYKSRGLAETIWQFDGGDGGAHKGLTLPGGVDSDFDLFNGDEDDLQR